MLVQRCLYFLSLLTLPLQVDVPTLDNRTLRVNIRDLVHPAYTKIVHGEGMPKPKSPSQRGDLIITFDVIYPRNISADAKEKLKELIPRS